jgi:hypothetical protein
MKELYKNDFDEESKYYNAATKCYEYDVYPYGKTESPSKIGFDKKGAYVYYYKSRKANDIQWLRDKNK